MAFIRQKGYNLFLVHNVRFGEKVNQIQICLDKYPEPFCKEVKKRFEKELSKYSKKVEVDWEKLDVSYSSKLQETIKRKPARTNLKELWLDLSKLSEKQIRRFLNKEEILKEYEGKNDDYNKLSRRINENNFGVIENILRVGESIKEIKNIKEEEGLSFKRFLNESGQATFFKNCLESYEKFSKIKNKSKS